MAIDNAHLQETVKARTWYTGQNNGNTGHI
jgi:hypothetical protein